MKSKESQHFKRVGVIDILKLMAQDGLLPKKVVIVGGGFGGVTVALHLGRLAWSQLKVQLISDKPHFEYSPALYRVVTGRSPLEVCLPLREIFEGIAVDILEDRIVRVDLANKVLVGGSGLKYHYDFLVLALGSQTAYFDIPGLQKYAFGFKSITEALRLKKHLHQIFADCKDRVATERTPLIHIIVVGAGASGVELSAELAQYTKLLAKNHGIDQSLVTVDLIEAAPRILPSLPEDFARRIEARLRDLGINIFVNRRVLKNEIEEVHLKDMEIKTKTLIWTAGVKPADVYKQIQGLAFDTKGRVIVDRFLQAEGHQGVFVIGDAAAAPYAGMAQTAINEAKVVAENIKRLLRSEQLLENKPIKPVVAIPVGRGWAAVMDGFRIYGALGWFLRRLADLRFFLSILPLKKAIVAFQSGKTLCETCQICSPSEAS